MMTNRKSTIKLTTIFFNKMTNNNIDNLLDHFKNGENMTYIGCGSYGYVFKLLFLTKKYAIKIIPYEEKETDNDQTYRKLKIDEPTRPKISKKLFVKNYHIWYMINIPRISTFILIHLKQNIKQYLHYSQKHKVPNKIPKWRLSCTYFRICRIL